MHDLQIISSFLSFFIQLVTMTHFFIFYLFYFILKINIFTFFIVNMSLIFIKINLRRAHCTKLLYQLVQCSPILSVIMIYIDTSNSKAPQQKT